MVKQRCTLILFVLFAAPLFAQVPQNIALWTGFESYIPLHEGSRYGLFAEGYLKRCDFVTSKQGWFWRVGGTYYLKNGNRISGGFAYQYNFPYDEVAEPYNWIDYRIWQQYMIRKVSVDGNKLWVHRIRPEERWLGRSSTANPDAVDHYQFEITFRYMLRRQWWFNQKFGAALSDELHLRLTDLDTEHLIDQNRIYGGFLFALDQKRETRIELGYMWQGMYNSADYQDGHKRINHTFRITFTSDLPMKR
jgi:hypothetical protein